MADTFASLQAELAARGTDYLDSTRAGRFINRGYAMLCDEYPWPFLEKTTSGTAPLTITDLGQVLYVADATNDYELLGDDLRTIVTDDPDLNGTGAAERWYIDGTQLKVYPSNTTATIFVRYIAVPTDLEAGTDEPLVPQRYRNLITDAAYYLALKDDDEYGMASQLKAMYDAEVQQMIARVGRNLQNPPSIVAMDW